LIRGVRPARGPRLRSILCPRWWRAGQSLASARPIMFIPRALLLSLSLATPTLLAQQCEPVPALPLAWKDFDAVRDRIVPATGADAWRGIPWLAHLGTAIATAAAADRPVLVWAMNGDPLGFT
jgi:hypothetical protein